MKTKLTNSGTTIQSYSKSERLIYITIFLWIIFGALGIYTNTSLPQLAGYYAALAVFIGTYLFGEYKRPADECTPLFVKGKTSSREIVIFITILLWCGLGIYGILKKQSLNDLTVYFASLTPFVGSYIIYKTAKGQTNDLPIFGSANKDLVDSNINNADAATKQTVQTIENDITKVETTINNTSLGQNSTVKSVEEVIDGAVQGANEELKN